MTVTQQPGEGLSDEAREGTVGALQGLEGRHKQERDIAEHLRSSASLLLHVLNITAMHEVHTLGRH